MEALVMSFECSACGHKLHLASSFERSLTPTSGNGCYPPAPASNRTVYVKPCQRCIGKLEAPAKKLQAMLDEYTKETNRI